MQVVINGAILCLTIVINTDELPFTNCMYLRHSHPSSSSGKIPVSYTQESVALFRAPNISTDVFFSRIYSQEKRTSSPHFHNSFSLLFFFFVHLTLTMTLARSSTGIFTNRYLHALTLSHTLSLIFLSLSSMHAQVHSYCKLLTGILAFLVCSKFTDVRTRRHKKDSMHNS